MHGRFSALIGAGAVLLAAGSTSAADPAKPNAKNANLAKPAAKKAQASAGENLK